MQTILGANGQIATILARELKLTYTGNIRLVSRHPEKVNETDILFPADLTNEEQTIEAVKGSEIAFLTVGMPMDTPTWAQKFPAIMQNVISACKKHSTRLVFFDNTYMYPQNDQPLTEETAFAPVGEKGRIRGQISGMLLDEINSGNINAVICRAPEFYGPGKTQSITNSLLFGNVKKGADLKVYLRDDTLRTLIWTPDAGKALALIGNTTDAYNQTWHLPCDDERLSYKELIALISGIIGRNLEYKIITRQVLESEAVYDKRINELLELLPRYEQDNIFDSAKFKTRFPAFRVTTYQQGIEQIVHEEKLK